MRLTVAPPDWTQVEIAVPRTPGELPGVRMAGFRHRAPAFVDIAMVAHPSVTLIVDLSDDEGLIYDAAGRSQKGSAFVGLLPGDVHAAGTLGECLQVRLSPVVAARAFGPAAGLTGTVAPFAEVWGRGAERFEDRLRAAASWDERFAIVVEVLGRRLNTSVDAEVAHIWQRTLAGQGRLRVDGLADEVGWSRKRLWERFRSQLGITPKRAAQLVRFDHAAHLLAAGEAIATVAAESGYVDQSHLHREVGAFAGTTPAVVAAAPWLAIDDVAWPVTPRR
ncbi:helix-turn-helix domain-containing protein [Kribbella pratensis]|uniref:Helix-turn-helix protein n=1 Tax=Kribbella pratensis TaxID=2512112 RepID=A0A4R8CMV2_9ACTN|nr:helix-turn-helix domain-containing protein [Kribbella pratensis]TDW77403.1 helix-turn-helix protein [Kribbella pratensis]